MSAGLFATSPSRANLAIGPQACLLGGFALPYLTDVMPALWTVLDASPFRRMVTPGGHTMSVALTNCGELGWITDRRGYRYARRDPEGGRPWPELPVAFLSLAGEAGAEAGFPNFVPDVCLINRYVPGARLSLHQDKNERAFDMPIVSVSLGLPATFLFGGLARADTTIQVPLAHGDVVVWGGVDRLRYHGVKPVKHGMHPQLGAQRINLTFRKAG